VVFFPFERAIAISAPAKTKPKAVFPKFRVGGGHSG
jgi:hypothetical protein